MTPQVSPTRARYTITGINGEPQVVPVDIIEFGAWHRDRNGEPWQSVRVFIPPFSGTWPVDGRKLMNYGG